MKSNLQIPEYIERLPLMVVIYFIHLIITKKTFCHFVLAEAE